MDALLQELSRWTAEAQALRLDLLAELVVAAILGGLVGWEREAGGKPAGLRTNMLICIGATLLTDLSVSFAEMTVSEAVRADPARITAQIVSGIGFLGAGTIIQARGHVTGLTTAATLWVVAAIGIGVGSGHYIEAVGTTVLVLATLVPLGRMEDHFQRQRSGRRMRLRVVRGSEAEADVEAFLEERGLVVRFESMERRRDDQAELLLEVLGPEDAFRSARQALTERADVLGVRVE